MNLQKMMFVRLLKMQRTTNWIKSLQAIRSMSLSTLPQSFQRAIFLYLRALQRLLKDLKQTIVAQAGGSFSNIDLNFGSNKLMEEASSALFGKPSLISSRVLVLRSIHGIIDGNRIVAVFFDDS